MARRVVLARERHVAYLRSALARLPRSMTALDASRPWLCYWILHSLALLEALPPEPDLLQVADFLARCQVRSSQDRLIRTRVDALIRC